MGQVVTLTYGSCVSNTITRVDDDSSSTTSKVEGENALVGEVHCGKIESLKDDLGHFLSIDLRVVGRLSKENGVLLWGYSELLVECVVPDLLHIFPVLDNTVLNRLGYI